MRTLYLKKLEQQKYKEIDSMAAFNKFNSFVEALAEKAHNLGSDQLTVALSTVAPVATDSTLSDITEVAYTNLSSRYAQTWFSRHQVLSPVSGMSRCTMTQRQVMS